MKNYYLTESLWSCRFSIPVYGSRTNYYDLNLDLGDNKEGIRGGDSGNPGFIILNDELVLMAVWFGGGGGSGASLTPFLKGEINEIMNLTGYSLTEIDLGVNGLDYDIIPESRR